MPVPVTSSPLGASGSDYGSDIDDDTWDTIISPAESHSLVEATIDNLEEVKDQKSYFASVHLSPRRPLNAAANASTYLPLASNLSLPGQIVSNGDKAALESPSRLDNGTIVNQLQITGQAENDHRSPLQRFRTAPQKSLSVTDLVSPAWCELQYWYSLTRYGRIRRTPAMKAGSKIHKQKEREIYVEVAIETCTAEDQMGLRLWNIVQGLRTLRTRGLTRELEVFGLISGEVVVGVIDEIVAACPNTKAENSLRRNHQGERSITSGLRKDVAVPDNQRTMESFLVLPQQGSHSTGVDELPPQLELAKPAHYHYLVDIKTRNVASLPPERQMKPTRMQLMLYHRMLSELAAGKVTSNDVCSRFSLDQDRAFSDTFLAELANLENESSQFAANGESPKDALDEITSHNTLSSLWTLMAQEFEKTIFMQNSLPTLSPLLTVEYRSSASGDVLGMKSFDMDSKELDAHLASTLQWWRGERNARGVNIEDAWKCGICEFAEGCTWRADKINEATSKARTRRPVKE